MVHPQSCRCSFCRPHSLREGCNCPGCNEERKAIEAEKALSTQARKERHMAQTRRYGVSRRYS